MHVNRNALTTFIFIEDITTFVHSSDKSFVSKIIVDVSNKFIVKAIFVGQLLVFFCLHVKETIVIILT
jgi:hypothetical protein